MISESEMPAVKRRTNRENEEIKFTLTIEFSDYTQMISLYHLLDDSLELFQSKDFQVKRQSQDCLFWLNLRAYGTLLTHQVNLSTFNSISEERFLQAVDTGDILLFRTQSRNILGSWITRAVTKSHFDHVAVILRFGESLKDLYILEAVGEKGVRLASWLNIRTELYHNGFFDKIVTRKLVLNMTTEQLTDLDAFRRNSTGLNYGIHPSKLMFTHRSEPQLGQESKQYDIHPERSFFCSELVAKAFKVLDLIRDPYAKSCGSYVPGSFEENCSIDKDMVAGLALGPSLNILVNYDMPLDKESLLQDQRCYRPVREPWEAFNCWL
jgi:hypothetical protein